MELQGSDMELELDKELELGQSAAAVAEEELELRAAAALEEEQPVDFAPLVIDLLLSLFLVLFEFLILLIKFKKDCFLK